MESKAAKADTCITDPYGTVGRQSLQDKVEQTTAHPMAGRAPATGPAAEKHGQKLHNESLRAKNTTGATAANSCQLLLLRLPPAPALKPALLKTDNPLWRTRGSIAVMHNTAGVGSDAEYHIHFQSKVRQQAVACADRHTFPYHSDMQHPVSLL
jgi:hypothetical protein